MAGKNQPVYNLSEDRTAMIKFVGIVERYPVIYDSTLPRYKNKRFTDQAWSLVQENMREELNLDYATFELKMKWKGIRSAFNKCKNKVIQRACNSDLPPTRKYHLYDHLRFLDPFTDSAKKQVTAESQTSTCMTNIETEPVRIPVSLIDHGSKGMADTQPSKGLLDDKNTTEYIPLYNVQSTSTDIGHASTSSEITNPLRCEEISSSMHIEIKDEVVEQEESSSDPVIEEPTKSQTDATDLQFFKCILPDIAHFTPAEKRKLKVGILTLIDEIETEREND